MHRHGMGGFLLGGIIGAAAAASAMMSVPYVRAPMMRKLRCHGRKLMRKAGQMGIL